MYATVDEDDYDDDMSTRARGTTAPLRMRGDGIPVVETVTEENTEEGTNTKTNSINDNKESTTSTGTSL